MQKRNKRNSLEYKLGRTHEGKSKGRTSNGRPVITRAARRAHVNVSCRVLDVITWFKPYMVITWFTPLICHVIVAMSSFR